MKAFDEIGEDWDSAHPLPMPVLKYFLTLVERKGVVLDAGCGTGRHFALLSRKSDRVVGVDSSQKMVEIANKKIIENDLKNVEVINADFASLPFEKDFFDYAFYMASLHHLTLVQQASALREMHRVLKKDGLVFITVWSRFQTKFEASGKEAFVSFKHAGKKVERYYYFFDEEELTSAAKAVGFTVVDSFFEARGEKSRKEGSHNLCFVLKRT